MKTLELASHSQHPTLERFLAAGYPFSLNTDDAGVFSTTCSKAR
jgi:adenosine deaminase